MMLLFLPRAAPGFASIGLGMVAAVTPTLQAVAIISGLLVVALAGVFTIRSNVAKIWREQAEGEKARNLEITAQLAEAIRSGAEEVATCKVENAALLAASERSLSDQLAVNATLQTALDAADARTDMTPVTALLQEIVYVLHGRTATITPIGTEGETP